MAERKQPKKHLSVIAVCAMLSMMTVLVIYSPTLYRLYCAVTGADGSVNRAAAPRETAQDETAQQKDFITVYFDANVAPGLDWDFYPAQREVRAQIGKPVKVYYYAKNKSDKTIVARALYNVTPYKIATYFFKVECFCFTNERLAPGETAKMPLTFYVDKQFSKDRNAQDVTSITLSYTFYNQKDLNDEQIQAARDLKAGSEARDAALTPDNTAAFANDAPRD